MKYERKQDGSVVLELSSAEISELESIVGYMAVVVDHDKVILELADDRISEWWDFLYEASSGEAFDDLHKRCKLAEEKSARYQYLPKIIGDFLRWYDKGKGAR